MSGFSSWRRFSPKMFLIPTTTTATSVTVISLTMHRIAFFDGSLKPFQVLSVLHNNFALQFLPRFVTFLSCFMQFLLNPVQ